MEIPFDKILSSIGEGVVVFDVKGQIIYLNPHASLLLDYTRSEIIGKKIDDVISMTVGDAHNPLRDNISKVALEFKKPMNSSEHLETVFLTSRGRSFPTAFITTPIFMQNEITGGIFVFRNTTVEEKNKSELIKNREDISRLTGELKAKGDLEKINKLMIGRELKMIELKQEIERLKREKVS